MKVVLFCGASGMRLRGYADDRGFWQYRETFKRLEELSQQQGTAPRKVWNRSEPTLAVNSSKRISTRA
jgi:hypothetical protein